jgi:pimeloyl-ACP methyl ester carboxylesterase
VRHTYTAVAFLAFVTCASAGEKSFDSKGVKIAYLDEGKGDPVVLLHGFGGTAAETWKAMPPSATDADVTARVEQRLRETALSGPMSSIRREARLAVVEDALAVVRAEMDRPRELRYALGEQGFGSGGRSSLAALEIAGSDGRSIAVEGRVDRIDLSPDRTRALVVDYKTGKAPSHSTVGVTA